ncbi:MAG TPA: erythromycin esterase family protein [Micromonospora sp.]|jgi:erythromycin esterase
MARYRDQIVDLAIPLGDPGDLDALLARVGDARVVMIGEASHGTHEFYQWRAAVTRRLIEECGFSFVAVEGDWPDCDRVDAAVRRRTPAPDDPRQVLGRFHRWPTWLWANEEVADFCRWLRHYNATRDPRERVGFHGLDVYSLWESLRAILAHLREHAPEQVPVALEAYRCFDPHGEDPQQYAVATRFVPDGCEQEVVDLLIQLRARDGQSLTDPSVDGDRWARFAAWQNAEVVAGAERYYRAMVRGGRESWNIRDRHMDETLQRLLAYYGPQARAVVWAHNTHVGDGRWATDMAEAGEVTIGQLARQRYGDDQVVLVGFGTHRGTVVAGEAWGAPMRQMPVPPARRGSLEDALHAVAPEQALFVFPPQAPLELLTDVIDHRAIGVVYHPEREAWGNYVPTVLGRRYDAFIWCDQTRAVLPLPTSGARPEEAQTYPAGV